MNGLLGLPPGLRGYVAAEQAQNQRGMSQLGMAGGLLGLQNQIVATDEAREMAPLRRALMEAQVGKALRPENPFSKIDPKDYTQESIQKFIQTQNPADLIPVRKLDLTPAGEAVNLFTAAPGTRFDVTTPHQQWQQNTQFPWQQGVDTANLSNAGARIGIDRANLFYNTGMGPMGGGASVPGGAPRMPSPGAPQPAALGVAPPRNAPIAPQAIVPPGATLPRPGVPPALGGGLTPKQIAEREADRPKETAALNSLTMNLDASIKEAENLLKSEGLSNITGPVMGRLPNASGSATNAQASLDTLKAQIGVRVLQAMREASKTGGAVGNVTEKEWPILQNQLGALQQSQTTAQFRKNLGDVKATLQKMKTNAVSTFEGMYGSSGKAEQNNDPLGLR